MLGVAHMKTLRRSVAVVCIGFVVFCSVYVLSAPLFLPIADGARVGRALYAPVTYLLMKTWPGRTVFRWYCYDVCKMTLILPIEVSGNESDH